MAAFIAAQRAQYRIPHGVSCRALGVSQSWFCKWAAHARDGTLPPRSARRARLAAEVRRLFEAHNGKRGSPVITADLQDAGWRVSENTVAKLMAAQNLAARPRRRRRSTTRPGPRPAHSGAGHRPRHQRGPEEARALEGLGRSHLQEGSPSQAAAHLQQALTIYQRIGAPAARRVQQTLQDHQLKSTCPEPQPAAPDSQGDQPAHARRNP